MQKRPPTRRLEPGDLICPDCGEGNPETRKFCSRCGASLETAQVVKAKWWRKFLPGKGPKKRKAGDRPSARKTRKSFPSKILAIMFGGVARIVGLCMLIFGLIYGLVPNVRDSVNEQATSAKDWFMGFFHEDRTQVNHVGVRVIGGTQIPGHGEEQLQDTATNTYWESIIPHGSQVLKIKYTFGTHFDLKGVAVWNGVGNSDEVDYNSTLRVHHVHLTFPGTNVDSCPVEFGDKINKESTTDIADCDADNISEVVITIDDYYPPGSKIKEVALAAVEFYKG